MKWQEPEFYGTALTINGKIVGWVTTTLRGKFKYGVSKQPADTKGIANTKREAQRKLESIFKD